VDSADAQPPLFTRPQLMLVGQATTPLFAALMLNWMRPDLVANFLQWTPGRLIGGGALLVAILHVSALFYAFTAINRRFPPATPGRRGRIAAVSLVCFLVLELPALSIVLLGPVAIALLHSA
jgi:hypothetical protein